jgi:hypothetical protein
MEIPMLLLPHSLFEALHNLYLNSQISKVLSWLITRLFIGSHLPSVSFLDIPSSIHLWRQTHRF